MKIKIIGSGGCVSTPRPLCQCKVCKEAREKGFPYARCGCSLFIEEENILIDTPEDINDALNHADVKAVDFILYSHIDPDHTMGMRVIEQIRLDWLAYSLGEMGDNPVMVGALPQVIDDLRCQGTKYGSMLEYYESMKLAEVKKIRSLDAGKVHIDLVPANSEETVAVFVISDKRKKVIYAPCDVKPFPESPLFAHADVLIIGNTIVGNTLKDGFLLKGNNALRKELFVMEEILALKEKYKIKKVIITHLEEDWGKSYNDYLEIQKQYDGIIFAFDGLTV